MLGFAFIFPALLVAGAAAVAPVIIHLVMRTKPRKIIFPALRFVRKTHQASSSKLKLKHLILLAMRMAIIVLIAVLLAGAQLSAWRTKARPAVPTAVAVIIDNSGSMASRFDGQAALARAKQMAQQIIQTLPDGSKVAVLSSDDAATDGTFLSDRKLAQQQVDDIPATASHASLAVSISRAVGALQKIDIKPKELYVMGDQTAQAWRDGVGAVAGNDIHFFLLDCSRGADSNVALGDVQLESTTVAVGSKPSLHTSLLGRRTGGDVNVVTELDGQGVDQRTVHLTAGAAAGLEVPLRAPREGLLFGRVVLGRTDNLDIDNVRYFCLQVSAVSSMLLVCDKTTDKTYFLMASLLEGSGQEGLYGYRAETVTTASLSAQKLASARTVVLADVVSLAPSQWEALDGFVRHGGQLWVVAGPMVSAASYNSPQAQKLLPAALKNWEQLAQPVAWQAAAADHPMLVPFAGDDNPPLNKVLCRGRMAIASLAPDARVVIKCADDVPAVVCRSLDRGTVTFWNFSPASLEADSLTQFGVLALRTARVLAADMVPTALTYGQSVTLDIPKELKNPLITLRRPDSAADEPLAADLRRATVSFKADRLGQYTLRFADGPRKIERGFSVNAEPAESDLSPVSPDKLASLLPPGSFTIAKDLSQLSQQRQEVSSPLNISLPVLLALLALLLAESFFSNRFYRQSSPQESAASIQ